MKQEIAEQWVAALRSGDYKQGTGCLRDDNNNFCCLGVLCNLHAQAHPKIAAKQKDPGYYMGADGWLPSEVKYWAGMNSDDGRFNTEEANITSPLYKNSIIYTLSEANDKDVQFPTIANFIEKNYELL